MQHYAGIVAAKGFQRYVKMHPFIVVIICDLKNTVRMVLPGVNK
jgi:hypothetical protein